MLRKILFATMMAVGLSVNAVSAEEKASLADQPVDEASTEVPTSAPANGGNVEIRDVKLFFNETFNDMQEDLETAKSEGKKALLIMFEMDECPFCHRMKTTVLNRSDVQDYFKENFYIVSVDIEGDVEMTDLKGENLTQKDFALKQFRVRATPVFQFIGLDGQPIKHGRLTGATKNAEEFMLLGKYIAEEKYKDMPFIKYKHEQTSAVKKDSDAQG